ncbi:hypothetical protein L218DRAFT_1010209 [Marasmius fiardii PR-910]|nr:hypothetical protein L218DRAFT_1010209 [Marasmius fiardii PR-910]
MADAAFEELVDALNRQQIVAYLDAVSVTLFEIEHIWKKKWTLLTGLYVLQRYLPLFDSVVVVLRKDLGASFNCTLYIKIAAWSFLIGCGLSQIILALRVWAVWERSIPVGTGLLVILLACGVAGCVFLRTVGECMRSSLPTHGQPFTVNSIVYITWLLMMVSHAGGLFTLSHLVAQDADRPAVANLTLMLIPGVRVYRSGGRTQLIEIVYRDGILLYTFLLLFSTIDVVIVISFPYLLSLLPTFERVIQSILTSRAILRIRQVARQGSRCPTLSQVRFAGNDDINLFSVHTEQRSRFARVFDGINSFVAELE